MNKETWSILTICSSSLAAIPGFIVLFLLRVKTQNSWAYLPYMMVFLIMFGTCLDFAKNGNGNWLTAATPIIFLALLRPLYVAFSKLETKITKFRE